MGKKLMVVGQGGREHALVWKLAQSPEVDKIYAAPGNPGISAIADCIDIAADDIDQLLDFARQYGISLTVVGPEVPLVNGIVDRFQAAGLAIFGPTAAAARLEGSKVFSKNLFKKYGIPTARYEVFSEMEAAKAYARTYTDAGQAVVIKADGLAAGKGVVVATTQDQAEAAIASIMLDKSFGASGDQVVVEECLNGEELSFFAIADGQDFIPLLSAQDHKRVFDNDEGPNTGGMGAYTNPPLYTEALHQQIMEEIIAPTVKAMRSEGCPYQGVLYAGLMITAEGPKVLEYNARFGDPETQVLMPMIKSDLLPVLEAAASGHLQGHAIEVNPGACVGVVLASGGYPAAYQKGHVITGLENLNPDTLVFHAGTAWRDGQLVTDGGRVLAVVSRGDTIADAIGKVYPEVARVNFVDMHFRRDIGRRALR
ncbi:MAG: phosphoribosylamine--glycine ligase [Firmicutes bacterium]|nr:phosphoribosylamine--glycine ligase [Bacillota bacterium]